MSERPSIRFITATPATTPQTQRPGMQVSRPRLTKTRLETLLLTGLSLLLAFFCVDGYLVQRLYHEKQQLGYNAPGQRLLAPELNGYTYFHRASHMLETVFVPDDITRLPSEIVAPLLGSALAGELPALSPADAAMLKTLVATAEPIWPVLQEGDQQRHVQVRYTGQWTITRTVEELNLMLHEISTIEEVLGHVLAAGYAYALEDRADRATEAIRIATNLVDRLGEQPFVMCGTFRTFLASRTVAAIRLVAETAALSQANREQLLQALLRLRDPEPMALQLLSQRDLFLERDVRPPLFVWPGSWNEMRLLLHRPWHSFQDLHTLRKFSTCLDALDKASPEKRREVYAELEARKSVLGIKYQSRPGFVPQVELFENMVASARTLEAALRVLDYAEAKGSLPVSSAALLDDPAAVPADLHLEEFLVRRSNAGFTVCYKGEAYQNAASPCIVWEIAAQG